MVLANINVSALRKVSHSQINHDMIDNISYDEQTHLRGLQGKKHSVRRLDNNHRHSKKLEGRNLEEDTIVATDEDSNIKTSEYLTHGISELSEVSLVSESRKYTNPIAVDDEFTISQNTAVEEWAPGLLRNDRFVLGDVLTIIDNSEPKHGILTIMSDGGFSYVPDKAFFGSDQFSYTVGNGNGEKDSATVTITVEKNDQVVDVVDTADTSEEEEENEVVYDEEGKEETEGDVKDVEEEADNNEETSTIFDAILNFVMNFVRFPVRSYSALFFYGDGN